MTNNIHIKLRYRGKLKHPQEVQQLILETEDICRTNGWSHNIWDEDWSKPSDLKMGFSGQKIQTEGHAPLKGISFNIGESETVWLTFLPNGLLHSLTTLANPVFFLNDAEFPWQRVKTGFDGATTHLAVCKLFRYLADKYFETFEVLDESNYWLEADDAKFTVWITNLTRDHSILQEELDSIAENKSISTEQKTKMTYRLLNEFGEKYRKK